jgi:hypothetical protein
MAPASEHRTWITRLVIGAVVALLFVAGADALRSSDHGTSAPASMNTDREARAPTPKLSTTTAEGGGPPALCTRQQIVVSLAVREQTGILSARTAGSRCRLPGLLAHLTIKDRAGNTIWEDGFPSRFGGAVRPGSKQSIHFPIPTEDLRCRQGGPFLALATLGPFSARCGNLSRREIACNGAKL